MAGGVPFQDLNRLHSSIAPALEEAYRETVGSGGFVGAATCGAFEANFAAAHAALGGVGTASGTDALVLALRALGIGPGDEVVVPAMTFVATAEAVVHAGATPVLADVDPHTLLLTYDLERTVRGPKVRAVIPVHLYGNMVNPADLRRWVDDGLIVVEDAAQAHLATADGMPPAAIGHAACFSFYPGKNLGALGDGGMIVSNHQEVLDAARLLRDHGRTSKYLHDEIGYCSRLDGLQAAFLDAKLRHLAAWTDNRRALAAKYEERLAGLPEISIVPWRPGAVHHILACRVDAGSRDAMMRGLTDCAIGCGIHYPFALSQQPSLAPWQRPCPNAERAATELVSLPMDPLMAVEDVDYVVRTLHSAAGLAA